MTAGALLEHREVPLGEEPVVVLLVEDDEQALADLERDRRRPARGVDGVGDGRERLVGQPVDEPADGGHPVETQGEGLVE